MELRLPGGGRAKGAKGLSASEGMATLHTCSWPQKQPATHQKYPPIPGKGKDFLCEEEIRAEEENVFLAFFFEYRVSMSISAQLKSGATTTKFLEVFTIAVPKISPENKGFPIKNDHHNLTSARRGPTGPLRVKISLFIPKWETLLPY